MFLALLQILLNLGGRIAPPNACHRLCLKWAGSNWAVKLGTNGEIQREHVSRERI